MHDPDGMTNPVKEELISVYFDEQIPWMKHTVYADEIKDACARNLRSRYSSRISYIDACIVRILMNWRTSRDRMMIS